MESTAIDRVRDLIEGVLADTADDEHRFRLRTALQLLAYVEEQHDAADRALAECEFDDETRQRLERLGYLG